MILSIDHKIFNDIIKSPHHLAIASLSFRYKKYDVSYMGFILPRILGPAHKRNLFKRRCKMIFHDMLSQRAFSSMGVIIKPKNIYMDYKDINAAFNFLAENVILK